MTSSPMFRATSMPDRDWWQALWPDPTSVLVDVGIAAGQRAVDLCSGDGYFTVPMAKLVGNERGQVFAVELDASMNAAARAAAQAADVVNIEFIQGDAMLLATLVPAPVDAVVIANTFHGAPDRAGLARAVRDVLDVGGRFAVINWWPRPREETTVLGKARGPRADLRFSPAQVAASVEPAGFRLLEVNDVSEYHYGAIFEATPAF